MQPQQQTDDFTAMSWDSLVSIAMGRLGDARRHESACRCGRLKAQHQLHLSGPFTHIGFHWPECPACEPRWSQLEGEIQRRLAPGRAAFAARCESARGQAIEQRVSSDIGMRLATSTFENFETTTAAERAALEGVRGSWWTRIPSVVLFGPPGTGKTHLAAASFREALAEGRDAVFVNEADLLREWRQAAAERRAFELLPRVVGAGILFLDDLGTGNFSAGGLELLYDVVDQRWRNGSPTLYTTNLGFAQLEVKFGEKLVSRILDRASAMVLPLDGVNRRLRSA